MSLFELTHERSMKASAFFEFVCVNSIVEAKSPIIINQFCAS
ncbi:hypothetical protein SNOG_02281 [Parastagonospora nodorum SN15]|uniref:Uncharacterized protein n=1 Tax=Phaeosphaeria nodorum (strain SN15 / ATCC MYA-4574 / FGSC 10173) TaxID=321614 RepID=Q0V133_PHANO|nr:hypothetical protein SNOG_02281 [Parastagonospora nodorum SN15]EAT90493.1 hypothetical protein SNOG_02281 [Parastagonospora nodorum SN15]